MTVIFSKRKAAKGGQIGMFETIMVMAVIVLIISMAIFYYYKFFLSNIEKKEEGLSGLERDIFLASAVAMPEINCSFNTVEQGCIDINKIKTGFIEKNKQDYFFRFGFKVVRIEQVYPEENAKENSIVIYNNPKQGFKKRDIVSVPVSIYFSEDDYRIGKLIVEVYR